MQPTNALYDKIRLQEGYCTTQKRVIGCKPFYGHDSNCCDVSSSFQWRAYTD